MNYLLDASALLPLVTRRGKQLIVEVYDPWLYGTTAIGDLTVKIDYGTITVDSEGKIWPPVEIWSSAEAGLYDIWADDGSGVYDNNDKIDDLDVSETGPPGTAGFFVIPEIPLGTIAVLVACFAAIAFKRKRLF